MPGSPVRGMAHQPRQQRAGFGLRFWHGAQGHGGDARTFETFGGRLSEVAAPANRARVGASDGVARLDAALGKKVAVSFGLAYNEFTVGRLPMLARYLRSVGRSVGQSF